MNGHFDDVKAYVDGELPEAERTAFESEMARNPDLAREVELTRRLGQIIRDEAASVRTRGLEDTLIALSGRPAITMPKRLPWYIWPSRVLAAATITGLVAVGLRQMDAATAQAENRAILKESMAASTVDKSSTTKSAPLTQNGIALDSADGIMRKAGEAAKIERIPVTPPPSNPHAPLIELRPHAADGAVASARPREMYGRIEGGSGGSPLGPADIVPLPIAGEPAASSALTDSPADRVKRVASGYGATAVATADGFVVAVAEDKVSAAQRDFRAAIGTAGSVTIDTEPVAQFKNQGRGSAGSQGGSTGAPGGLGGGARDANTAFAASSQSELSLDELKKQVTDLEAQRVRLLVDFYEDSKPIKEIDQKIADARAELKRRESAVAKTKPGQRLIRIRLTAPSS